MLQAKLLFHACLVDHQVYHLLELVKNYSDSESSIKELVYQKNCARKFLLPCIPCEVSIAQLVL